MLKGQKKGIPMNLVGNVYGRLTVLSLARRGTDERKYYYWLCRCSCGKEKVIHQELLRSGRTRSCGCLLRDSRFAKNKNFDRELALLKILYSHLKKRNEKRFGSNGFISLMEFKKLSFSDCFYCGSKPASKQEDVRHEAKVKRSGRIPVTDTVILFNGIDRVDSGKGYTINNVVTCCKHCNRAKNSLSQDDFKNLIKRIYSYWANR